MDANCSDHSKPAIFYCKDHAKLCCGNQCFKDHSKHNTLTIEEYCEALPNIAEFNKHMQTTLIVINVKDELSILFEKLVEFN